ncbi:MAG: nucleotide-binding protein [Pseudomonadota bacterium]
MRQKLRVFIASSIEGLPVAEAVNINLDRSVEATLWTLAAPAQNFIDNLLSVAGSVDCAVFIFSPDDTVMMRGTERHVIRDNVLFELGLFMGRLGKEKCFVIKPRNTEIHIPSDLLGFTVLDYEENRSDKNLIAATKSASSIMATAMEGMVTPKRVLKLSSRFDELSGGEGGLELISSFPKLGDKISRTEIPKIYLKFNKAIDRDSVMYICNYYVQQNMFAQWNVGGWIQFAENDTKLIWHIHDHWLNQDGLHDPLTIDYQKFEIHIGRDAEEWRLKDVEGNYFPRTIIPVFIKE